MRTPLMGNILPPNRLWAADTGAYNDPFGVDFGAYLRWLEKHTDEERSRCLFACTLDVPKDWPNTLARGVPRLRHIRELGYPVAMIAQNGATADQIPWDGCDALFLGPEPFKFSQAADQIVRVAKAKGKHVHNGKISGARRFRAAYLQGCDSADGTYIAFGPEINIPKLQGWLDDIQRQPMLWEPS